MRAGLLRRVVDTVQRYRAVLGSDELVQSRRSSLAIYRNRVLVGPSPWDTQRVEGIREKAEDVLGPITEVVPHALDSAIVGDDTAAVAVYESEDELLGLRGGLPCTTLKWRTFCASSVVDAATARPFSAEYP